jgi:hypothetical protein
LTSRVLSRKQRIYCCSHICVNVPLVAFKHLNGDVEGWGRGALEDALLHTAALRLVITCIVAAAAAAAASLIPQCAGPPMKDALVHAPALGLVIT